MTDADFNELFGIDPEPEAKPPKKAGKAAEPKPSPREKQAAKTEAKQLQRAEAEKDSAEVTALRNRLLAYRDSPPLAQALTEVKYDWKRAASRDPVKLAEELQYVERLLARQSRADVVDDIVKAALMLGENVAVATTPLQINGLAEACFKSEKWLFLFERAKTKYGLTRGYSDPALDLAVATFQAGLALHNHNRDKKGAAPAATPGKPHADLNMKVKRPQPAALPAPAPASAPAQQQPAATSAAAPPPRGAVISTPRADNVL
jgi:hypothetical protein